MGAEQSSSRGAAGQDAPKKTDYYELLGIERTATEDEIKKAYRKKALVLHPDRNYGDVERATALFAEVQSAYEVLSDPQERAWYDSHREAILRGDDPNDPEAHSAPEFKNVRAMTSEEIYSLIGRFNKAVPMDDSPHSFFTILAETFERLNMCEIAAAEMDPENFPFPDEIPEYPPFGCSDDDDGFAKKFYSGWGNFATRLSFSWKDKWRLSDAPDRRVRRLMEKENVKFREDAKREFNDAVRSLVVFVRKRDPRYIPNTQTEAERQQVLRDSAAQQAARSRAANLAKMNDKDAVPEWARTGGGADEGMDEHLGEFTESEEESEIEVLECVVCDKVFKSEKQYEAHEKSKKHIKAVQALQRQMRKENKNLDLKEKKTDTFTPMEEDDESPVEEVGEEGSDDNDGDNGVPFEETKTPKSGDNKTPASSSEASDASEDEDDEYASREAVEARLGGGTFSESTKSTTDTHISTPNESEGPLKTVSEDVDRLTLDENDNEGTGHQTKKVGKAKAKREKKAAKQVAEQQSNAAAGHKCVVCNEEFDSKTKLFKHIDVEGHAALKTVAGGSGSKAGGKKKKGKR